MQLEFMSSEQPSHRGTAVMPAALTDTGCERELNEDRYAVIESGSGVAWVVADGMGGVSGGELAAQLAIDAMRRHLETNRYREVESALRAAVLEANRVIVLRRQNPLFSGMGTTVVAAMFKGPRVVIAHAGDSRAYLVREGMVHHLTLDHTLVQEMVSRGELPMEDALNHPQAHVLTRCLGSEPGLRVDVAKYWIHRDGPSEGGDKVVLMSDGLYSLVSDVELAAVVSDLEPQRACVHLVELAKSRGGFDNITIAVIPVWGALREQPSEEFGNDSESEGEAEGRTKLNVGRLVAFWIVSSIAVAMMTVFAFTAYFLC